MENTDKRVKKKKSGDYDKVKLNLVENLDI